MQVFTSSKTEMAGDNIINYLKGDVIKVGVWNPNKIAENLSVLSLIVTADKNGMVGKDRVWLLSKNKEGDSEKSEKSESIRFILSLQIKDDFIIKDLASWLDERQLFDGASLESNDKLFFFVGGEKKPVLKAPWKVSLGKKSVAPPSQEKLEEPASELLEIEQKEKEEEKKTPEKNKNNTMAVDSFCASLEQDNLHNTGSSLSLRNIFFVTFLVIAILFFFYLLYKIWNLVSALSDSMDCMKLDVDILQRRK